jgi:non-ribosomal peptide synthetase component F
MSIAVNPDDLSDSSFITKMPQKRPSSLWNELSAVGDLPARFISCAGERVASGGQIGGSVLYCRGEELRGRSVLIMTADQLTMALALIELDGVARRIVVCPSDLPTAHLPFVIDAAAVDAVVSDRTSPGADMPAVASFIRCGSKILPGGCNRGGHHETEWVLLTSGTTGPPKLVVHTLASLTGAIKFGASSTPVVWSTFYDIRRYGGLQIFLRAVLTGVPLVLSSADESTVDFLARAGTDGVTHISGTPSHWRRALMSPSAHKIAPQYIRLSGEIADQTILNHLQAFYPQARIVHAFASTEAGVAFEVADGIAGVPAGTIEDAVGVEMKITDGSLRIRSPRTAARYLGERSLRDAEGFVDTGDMLELRDGRYYFIGRRDGVINFGGFKIHPEEVEGVINRHPEVQTSLVRTKKNSVTGALVVADVVLKTGPQPSGRDLQRDILRLCREALPSYKVPAGINFVPCLKVADTGKILRS